MLLSLGLEGFFFVCRKTLEKASFICWSTVFNRKYLNHKRKQGRGGQEDTMIYPPTICISEEPTLPDLGRPIPKHCVHWRSHIEIDSRGLARLLDSLVTTKNVVKWGWGLSVAQDSY